MHSHVNVGDATKKAIPVDWEAKRHLDGPTPGYDITDEFCPYIHKGKHTDFSVKNYPLKGRDIFLY